MATTQDLRAQLARNPNDLETLERLDLMLNLAGNETEAEEMCRRLTRAWRAQGGHRPDWVRLTGTADNGFGVTVSQFYRPQPYGLFIFHNEIRVFDPKLPPASCLKRLFRLESKPDIMGGIMAAINNRSSSSDNNSTTEPRTETRSTTRSQAYFLREYFIDGSNGGGTHNCYGTTRPSVRQLLEDVLSAVNKSSQPMVSFVPGRNINRNANQSNNSACAILDSAAGQLDTEISKIVSSGGAVALKVLKKYIQNLVEHPDDPKYRKINTQNSTYRSKIQPFGGASAVLRLVGFGPSREDPMFLEMSQEANNEAFQRQALQKLENVLGSS